VSADVGRGNAVRTKNATKKRKRSRPKRLRLRAATPRQEASTPARPAKNLAAVSSAPIPAATPVADAHAKEDSPADTEPTGTVPASAHSTVESAGLAQVTITGCLEISTDEDRFRLTDTDGASAPKSRSWRTGFLKKRAAPVDLVWPSDTRAPATQVGKRVAATGVLMSRALKVTSVRIVSPSCN
jgi:hypothetical protein